MHISGIFDPKVLELCVELVYSIDILTKKKDIYYEKNDFKTNL